MPKVTRLRKLIRWMLSIHPHLQWHIVQAISIINYCQRNPIQYVEGNRLIG